MPAGTPAVPNLEKEKARDSGRGPFVFLLFEFIE